MKTEIKKEETLRQYLLGDMTDDERHAVGPTALAEHHDLSIAREIAGAGNVHQLQHRGIIFRLRVDREDVLAATHAQVHHEG